MLVGLDRSSLFSLQGKVALLTGASGFLGRTFAETLLANGAELVAIGRPAKLAKQQQLWSEKYGPGPRALLLRGHVRSGSAGQNPR